MNSNYSVIRFKNVSFETTKPLGLGKPVVFQGKGVIQNQNLKDLNDGSCKVVEVIEPEILDIKEAEFEVIAPETILKDGFKRSKSMSKRMRDAFYILWQSNEEKGDFEAFYEAQMSRLIDKILQKVEGA